MRGIGNALISLFCRLGITPAHAGNRAEFAIMSPVG
jgi:hypothetical protein